MKHSIWLVIGGMLIAFAIRNGAEREYGWMVIQFITGAVNIMFHWNKGVE